MQHILDWLTQLAEDTNVTIFSVVGSFLEEIIAPIPSPFVLTTTGVLAQANHYTWWQIAGVVLLVSLAKTVASWILYIISDKSEDFLFRRFGKFLPVTHQHVEQIGAYLTGTWWDDLLLFIARSLPIIPSLPISVAAGVIKYNLHSYLIVTFLGSIVRSGFYVWVGYLGIDRSSEIWQYVEQDPVMLGMLVIGIVIAVLALVRIKEYLWKQILKK